MQDKLAQGSFLLLLAAVTLLFGWVLLPFASAVLWAIVTAIIFYPLRLRLARRLGERRNLLAATVLLISTVSVILPLLGVVVALAQEGAAFYDKVQSGEIDLAGYFERNGIVPPIMQNALQHLGVDFGEMRDLIKNTILQTSRFLASHALGLGQNMAQFLISFTLMLYLTFFFLRDGDKLLNLLVRALPLGDERERLLLRKMSEIVGATIRGNLIVATIQGTLGGLIFWILGVPSPALWGVAMILLSLLPAVGAALVWAPVAAYFILTGMILQGVVLIAFGAGVIGLVDNVLRPILVGRETKMPDYLVLVSTLGGLSIFGLSGFVVGPLIAALFMSVWQIFVHDFDPS